MPRQKLSPEALALICMRLGRGLLQKELAARLGLSDYRQISRYESGEQPLSRETLDSIATVLEYSREAVEALISIAAWLSREPPYDPSPVALTPEEFQRINRAALAVGIGVAHGVHAYLTEKKKQEKAKTVRGRARELWRRLKSLLSPKRREMVAESSDLVNWALAERICELSVQAAADDPRKALDLADLALFIADRVQGEEVWRHRLKGYVWAYIANARRVANDFTGADEAFIQAWDLWRAGADSDPSLLPEWRMLSLEASLRREQHRFPEALALLDRAAKAAGGTPIAAGRVLLQKEHVLEQMGDVQGALAALEEATPFIEAEGDPRLLFAHRFETANDLCHLKRFEEAESLLQQVHELAVMLSNEMDLVRVVWLRARVAIGQGRREDAIASLEQVRWEFTARRLPYDAARASLELATLWLEEGRTADVRNLSLTMFWIFKAQGIAREALAALAMFCDAAQQETVTVELIQQVIADLEKARCSAPRPRNGPKGRD